MEKYILFDIENEEPVKITSTLMQRENEDSKGYIPGSAIRGAFIANYINIKNVKDINKEKHKEMLLNGGIKFLNAYPVISGNRSLPFPKNNYTLKEEQKKFSLNKEMSIYKLEKNSNKDYEKVKRIEYVNFNFDKNIFETKAIGKIDNLHIKKDKVNKLFRYEAIKPGNIFRGIIKCEKEDYCEVIEEIINNGMFYLGGSKGTGYGKCRLYNIKIKDNNPELEYLKNNKVKFDEEYFNENETFCIYATSDIIYRDKRGVYKSFIDEEYLKEKLELNEVNFEDSFIDTEYFTGFNNKWGYKLPVVNGIKAGSVFKYSFKGNLVLNNLRKLMEEGIGERKQDGFGRFIILSDIDEDFKFNKIENMVKREKSTKEISITNNESKAQFELILNRIYLNKLNEKIPENILNLNNRLKLNLTSSQISKLTNLMNILQGLKYEDGIKRLDDYFNHMDSKKINRDLSNALKKPVLDRKSLKDYLKEDELDNTDINNFQSKYGQPLKIGGIQSELKNEKQTIYEYKVKIFKELFRLQYKENNKVGEN